MFQQVVIALTGGELVYFEMDPVSLKCPKLITIIVNLFCCEIQLEMVVKKCSTAC